MNEALKYLIAVGVLFFGYFIGVLLRKNTLDEQKDGRIWFSILSILSLMGTLMGFLLGKDWLLFSSAFIAIVTVPSLKKVKESEKKE